MIKHLLFSDQVQSGYRRDESNYIPCLTDLARINVFVGPNNSGKSRAVRNILAYDHVSHFHLTEDEQESSKRVLESKFLQSDSFERNHLPNLTQYFSDEVGANFDGMYWRSVLNDKNLFSLLSIADALFQHLTSRYKRKLVAETVNNQDWTKVLINFFSYIQQRNHTPRTNKKDYSNAKRIYIPLLRGLRPLIRPEDMIEAFGDHGRNQKVTINLSELTQNLFGSLETTAFKNLNDLYKRATERDYPELKSKCKIFTGLSIYWDIMDLLLGSDFQRKQVQTFEDFLSNKFFEGQAIDLTPTKGKPGTLSVKIGNREGKLIHDLGDGIQSIITLLYPIYTQLSGNEYAMIGIEEPENSLHPGLQRVFLDALSSFPNAQFFITTHSNHFLEAIEERGDTAIFRVESNDYEINNETKHFASIIGTSYGDFKTLECLGVLNTSVFLANCTIWVEGPTDRRIFRHYLELYKATQSTPGKQLIEDKHFSFVEYGGSNITHLSILDDDPHPINVDHLCGKMLLIADDDNAAGAKLLRNSTLAVRLGKRFLRLRCKELENLCSPFVLNRIVSHYSLNDEKFDLNSEWSTYATKALGKFLDQRIAKRQFKLGKGKKQFADGNTIADKVRFCDLTIQHTKTWSDLSEEGMRVAKAIYDFIYHQNFINDASHTLK